MIVRMRPNNLACFQLAQLGIEINAGDNFCPGNLLEVVQMPGEDEVSAGIAAQCSHAVEPPRGAQAAHHGILQHVYRRRRPPFIGVGAHLRRRSAINDAIFAVQVRGKEYAHQQIDVRLLRPRGGQRRIVDLVVPNGLRLATARNARRQKQQHSRPLKLAWHLPFSPAQNSHGCSPGLCSLGLLEFTRLEGRDLISSVNSRKFSEAWRKLSRITSMFSELTSSVWFSRRVSSSTVFSD